MRNSAIKVLPLEVGTTTTTERRPEPSNPCSRSVSRCDGHTSRIGSLRLRSVSDLTKSETRLLTARATIQMVLLARPAAAGASRRTSISRSINCPSEAAARARSN